MEAMTVLTVASNGPDNPNKAILPFVSLKGSIGAASEGNYPEERPEMFLMQEGVYLASNRTDLYEIKAVGLPPVGEVLDFLRDYDVRLVACKPCAEGRGLTHDDQLIDAAEMGEGKDLAAMSRNHEQVLTF